MKRIVYVPALLALVGLMLVSSPAPAGAQASCKATITTDKIEEGRNDNWTIWLTVDAGDCATSSGSFTYTVVVRRSGGSVEELTANGSWVSERPSSGVSVQYRLSGGGKVEDAREFRDIRCDCLGD